MEQRMTNDIWIQTFLEKANESLAGAASEFSNGRYNNSANRCYYACFQAAIAALMQASIRPSDERTGWGHDFVQAQFVRQFISQRKVYPAAYRDVLSRAFILRRAADYRADHVPEVQARRNLRRVTEFVEAITQGEGEPR